MHGTANTGSGGGGGRNGGGGNGGNGVVIIRYAGIQRGNGKSRPVLSCVLELLPRYAYHKLSLFGSEYILLFLGGVVTTNDGYTMHTFNSDGTYAW